MGISKKDIERFKEIDLIAYEMFKNGHSLSEIAKHFSIKRQSLSKRLKEKFEIEVLANGKKQIDSIFFNDIDSKEKAYWLGFLYADGYVGNDNRIELCLKESDKKHIEKFKNAIKSEHKISIKKNILQGKEFISYRIVIRDELMNKSLKALGCINNKSLVCEFPLIKDELLIDFIRGYFDGDGCIFFDKRSSNLLPRAEFSCGSKKFITELQCILKNKFNLKTSLYNDRNIYSLRFGNSKEAKKFLNLIYENSHEHIRLDRKYKLYTHLPS